MTIEEPPADADPDAAGLRSGGDDGEAPRLKSERTQNVMIDLNTANAEELDGAPQLKGHGFEIVRTRDERGRFDSLRQLDEAPGLAGKWDGAEAEVRIG